jgi:hypothetical protein
MLLVLIGRLFIAAYLIAVAATFFPVRFSELGWQQQVLDSLVNAGTIPITGRVFILLAIAYKGYDLAGISDSPPVDQVLLAPRSGLLGKRKIARLVRNFQINLVRAFRFLKAYSPSLLFVLAAILQLVVSTRSFRALDIGVLNQSSLLTQQATQVRAAITGSGDRSILQRAIQGFVPEPERESILSLPVDQQRVDLTERLNNRESVLRSELEKQRSQRFAALVVQTIKNVLLSLLFAWCFFWLRPASIRAFIRGVS